MIDIKKIADNADMIVNGYAFTKEGKFIKILNLNNLDKASVLNKTGEIIETNMDEIELSILLKSYNSNKKYLEETESA